MVCIYCGGNLTVQNSRSQQRRNQTWRRRKCASCKAIFTSTEALELGAAISIKKGVKLQPFSRDTLFISIYESCKHRPSAASDASGLTDTVVMSLLRHAMSGLLAVETITVATHSVLKRFDEAAAVQYAAFHPLPHDI